MFRISLKISLILAAMAFVLVSCENDDTDDLNTFQTEALTLNSEESYFHVTVEDELYQDAMLTVGGDHQPCFTPVFPLTILYADGTAEVVQDGAELKDAIKAYYLENGRDAERPSIEFPHDVELSDGTVLTVESKEDVKELLKDCRESIREERRCYNLIFPITLEYPDGTTEIFDNKDSLKLAIKDWKESNPDAEEKPVFQYPYQVEDQDGNIHTLENDDDKRELIVACRPDRTPCFEFVFPVTLVYPDGTAEDAGSDDELQLLIIDWKENNPDANERPVIQFPQDVELANGNVINVESAQQLALLTKRCRSERHRDRKPRRRGRR